MEQTEKVFRTSDLNMSAYLLCAKVELLDVEKDKIPGSRRSYMIFRKNPGHDKLVTEYFNCKGKVVAKEFANHLRDLKARIYAE